MLKKNYRKKKLLIFVENLKYPKLFVFKLRVQNKIYFEI